VRHSASRPTPLRDLNRRCRTAATRVLATLYYRDRPFGVRQYFDRQIVGLDNEPRRSHACKPTTPTTAPALVRG
jgi:hypothetical protein